jgi:hypothetical protein
MQHRMKEFTMTNKAIKNLLCFLHLCIDKDEWEGLQ